MIKREAEREEEYDAKQREASRAGLVAGLLFMILAAVFIFAAFTWGPAFQTVSPPQAQVQKSEE